MEVQDSRSATLGRSENWANNKRLRVGLTVPSDGVVRLIFRGRIGKDTAFYQIICTECLCSMVLRPVERLVFSPKER